MVDIKRGQIWSYDVMIAVGVFIVAFITFYALISFSSPQAKTAILSSEGNVLATSTSVKQESTNVSFIINNAISPLRLNRTARQNYTDIKSELGLTNDFCLHFEDENGNIIDINGVKAIGSSEINLSLDNEIITCTSG